MAITIHIYYTGKSGNARKFAQEMVASGIVKEIRAEPGNTKYAYFFPMEDTQTVLLIDGWKDQASLDIHHASPMMKQIAELREKYDLHMRVERYSLDDTGIPASDKEFLR